MEFYFKIQQDKLQEMGNCTGANNGHQYEESEIQKYKSLGKCQHKKVDEKQFQLLHLVYDDLAKRIKEHALSIDNFLLFFHKNGEWGDRLFEEFDTDSSQYISQPEFIKGIVKIFKTSEQQKIQLLYKFFSREGSKPSDGISFKHFLTMLYNYPKEDIKKILNDQDFVNKELRNHLRAIDNNKYKGRRLMSFYSGDASNKQVSGMKFKIDESDSGGSERIESKVGHQIIRQINKETSIQGKQTTFKIRVGENDVEVKTASIHHLVKKMAKSIFRQYKIDQKKGKLKFQDFYDWIKKHKNLYDDYYKGFHNEVWELDVQTKIPMYLKKEVEIHSKARFLVENRKIKKVYLSLLNNVIIVCEENEQDNPLMIICLEGLVTKTIFDEAFGYGIQITHRDGFYEAKKFFMKDKDLMTKWMDDYLKYFKGTSISQSYQIREKIGTGKFSIVYKAKEKATGQLYALKVIESFKLDDESRNLIAHESTVMQIFQHPLLVGLKETIKTKNHIYIVTELVNGKDLYQFVKDLKYLNEPEAAYIIQQLIVGVRYLHSLGLVHRDLKPQNVMIEYNEPKKSIGKIKIIDFGFANHLLKLKNLTPDQLLAGTPNYIAPEVLMKEDFSQKIDNFAIGSILYFSLSGNAPFNSHETTEVLEKTMEGAYVLNDKRWKQISTPAKDLVQKLLELQPENRISLDDALNHPWFEKFHCVGGAAYSIKETEKGISLQK